MNAVGIAIATVVGLVLSGTYYAVAPATSALSAHEAPHRTAVTQALVELVRSAATAGLLSGLVMAGDFQGLLEGATLGAAMWVLPVVLLSGSVFHEGTPVRAAVVHAGDWLLKLLVIGAIVGSFA